MKEQDINYLPAVHFAGRSIHKSMATKSPRLAIISVTLEIPLRRPCANGARLRGIPETIVAEIAGARMTSQCPPRQPGDL
jgi:hypothetical protein